MLVSSNLLVWCEGISSENSIRPELWLYVCYMYIWYNVFIVLLNWKWSNCNVAENSSMWLLTFYNKTDIYSKFIDTNFKLINFCFV